MERRLWAFHFPRCPPGHLRVPAWLGFYYQSCASLPGINSAPLSPCPESVPLPGQAREDTSGPMHGSLNSWGPFMLLQPQDVPSFPPPTLLGDSFLLLLFLQTSSRVPSHPHVVLTPISLRKPNYQRACPTASMPTAQSFSAPAP